MRGYARQSIRGLAESGGGADYEYATNWSLAPSELPTLVLPSASGFGSEMGCKLEVDFDASCARPNEVPASTVTAGKVLTNILRFM